MGGMWYSGGMKAKIFVYTFRVHEHQGSTIPVGTVEMEVTRRTEQVVRREGCESGELVYVDDTPTIMIGGRRFLCEQPWGCVKGVDYQVGIPWDLAEKVKKCPHCGGLL